MKKKEKKKEDSLQKCAKSPPPQDPNFFKETIFKRNFRKKKIFSAEMIFFRIPHLIGIQFHKVCGLRSNFSFL